MSEAIEDLQEIFDKASNGTYYDDYDRAVEY